MHQNTLDQGSKSSFFKNEDPDPHPEASEFATLVGSVKDPYHLMRIQIQDLKNKILRMRPEFNSDPGPEK